MRPSPPDNDRDQEFADALAILNQAGLGSASIGQANYVAEMDLNRDGTLDAGNAYAVGSEGGGDICCENKEGRFRMEPSPNKNWDHAYAIVRISVPSPSQIQSLHLRNCVRVTAVMWDRDAARAEAARLNSLNGPKGESYEAEIVRIERR